MNKINSVFYMYSNMDKSSQVLLFLIILVALMLVSIFVINLITKKKNSKYDASISNITRYSDALEKEKKVEKIEVKVKEEKEEILFDEPEVIEVVSKNNSIEEISKMIENTLEQEPINLTLFEEEQEKDAIISYDELVKRAGAKKIVYKVETKEEPVKEEIKEEPKTEYTGKFKTSQIISPIYGIQKEKEKEEKIDVILDVEEYLFNNKKEDIQMMDDMEFLGTLKSFRSELD